MNEMKSDAADFIKNYFLDKYEYDKFKNIKEYESKKIQFHSVAAERIVTMGAPDSYFLLSKELQALQRIKSESSLKIIYRSRGDSGVLFIRLLVKYMDIHSTIVNPRYFKNVSLNFLADGERVDCGLGGTHISNPDVTIYPSEMVLWEIGLDKLVQLISAKELEFRISDDEPVLMKELDLLRIKGFYNSVFDQTFELDYLINRAKEEIEEIEEEKKRREEEKKRQSEKVEEGRKRKNSKEGCFIITATMGDKNHPIVSDFRYYRDQHLMTNYFGRLFVKIYYIIGPKMAKIIDKKITFRKYCYKYIIKPTHKYIIGNDKQYGYNSNNCQIRTRD